MDEGLSVALESEPRSPARARRALERYLDRGQIDGEVKDLVLVVVSELTSNAVVHGQEPIEVHAELFDDVLRVEVSDNGPQFDPAVALRGAGRGLRIVDEFTRRWGVAPRDTGGKRVWAEVPVPA